MLGSKSKWKSVWYKLTIRKTVPARLWTSLCRICICSTQTTQWYWLVASEVRTFECTTSQESHLEEISEWCKNSENSQVFFVKDVLKARCTDNLSSQQERYTQPESSSLYTVMYVDQCLLSQLVLISSDINQKCWRNLRSLKQLPQLIHTVVARELGHCEQTSGDYISLQWI